MDSKIHAESSQPLSENSHFKSFQASSVSRRMEMRNKDLGSTFPEVKRDPERRMNRTCLQELVKMTEEMEKAIIKEKSEILEESKRIIEQNKIIEGMQKKVNEFLGVQNLKFVELNYLWLFSRPLKFYACYFIALLLFYKSLHVLAWLCLQLNNIYWHYLPCEYPY